MRVAAAIAGAVIGGTSLTDVLLLANFIWLRYAVSSFVRETFAAIGIYTNPYLDSPNTPGIIRTIYQKFKALAPSPRLRGEGAG